MAKGIRVNEQQKGDVDGDERLEREIRVKEKQEADRDRQTQMA